MADRFVFRALQQFNVQSNPTIQSFFSDNNIRSLQSQLKKQVFHQIGQRISSQSCEQMFIVMSYVYSNHGRPLHSSSAVSQQVLLLNQHVLDELVPMVTSNVKQYLQYIKDISSLPVPIDHSVSTSVKGNNSLQLNDPF